MTKVGQLGAQGIGEVIERFAMTAQALVRQRGLNGAAAMASEKTEEEEKPATMASRSI